MLVLSDLSAGLSELRALALSRSLDSRALVWRFQDRVESSDSAKDEIRDRRHSCVQPPSPRGALGGGTSLLLLDVFGQGASQHVL